MKSGANIQISSFLERVSGNYLPALNVGISRVAVFSLLMLIFYYSSVLFWQVMYPQDFKVSATLDLPKQIKSPRLGLWNWFVDTAPGARKSAAPSKLKARLLGVIAQGGEGEGIALIALAGKAGKIFHVGDEVSSSIFLQRVEAHYVNLERDGQIEILEIKRINLFTGEGQDQDDGTSGYADSGEDDSLSLVNLRETLIKQPTKLAEILQFERTKGPEGVVGFKVRPKGKNEELFAEMGFIKGDIITSVNDQAVADLIKDPKSWQSLLKSEGINLQVMREGVPTDIFIQ